MTRRSRHSLSDGSTKARLTARNVFAALGSLDDPDAPAGTWHHWAVYDIPSAVTELAVNGAQNTKMKQAVNDFRKVGYGGPCPPHGHGPHHYHFRLLALSTDHLRAKSNASCPDIEREARKHAIAEAILVGWYER